MNESRSGVIRNACMIVAIRELIGDPDWLPPDVAATVLAHDGYPNSKNRDLEGVAPVLVFLGCNAAIVDGGIRISGDGREVVLGGDSRVAVGRRTTPGRGHVECVSVPRFAAIINGIAEGREDNNIISLIVRADAP